MQRPWDEHSLDVKVPAGRPEWQEQGQRVGTALAGPRAANQPSVSRIHLYPLWKACWDQNLTPYPNQRGNELLPEESPDEGPSAQVFTAQSSSMEDHLVCPHLAPSSSPLQPHPCTTSSLLHPHPCMASPPHDLTLALASSSRGLTPAPSSPPLYPKLLLQPQCCVASANHTLPGPRCLIGGAKPERVQLLHFEM